MNLPLLKIREIEVPNLWVDCYTHAIHGVSYISSMEHPEHFPAPALFKSTTMVSYFLWGTRAGWLLCTPHHFLPLYTAHTHSIF